MFKSKKTLGGPSGDKAFQEAAQTLWNKLPSALRMEASLKPFKVELKTLLYDLRLLTQTPLTKGVVRQQSCYVFKNNFVIHSTLLRHILRAV